MKRPMTVEMSQFTPGSLMILTTSCVEPSPIVLVMSTRRDREIIYVTVLRSDTNTVEDYLAAREDHTVFCIEFIPCQ